MRLGEESDPEIYMNIHVNLVLLTPCSIYLLESQKQTAVWCAYQF